MNVNLLSKKGENVSLEEMLNARERRMLIQQRLLKQYQYPLISFTLNMVGSVKIYPLAIRTYEEGISLIRSHCIAWGLPIIAFEELREKTGYEGIFVINANSVKMKEIASALETQSEIGRLFDIDVIQINGEKIARTDLSIPERKCLLCNKNAFECGRSRAHNISDLIQKQYEIMWNYFSMQYSHLVASIATRALLYEVTATPKPGLVDQLNNGAHKDMDIYTFESSALALMPYFTEFIQCGIQYSKTTLDKLFEQIRPIGIQAELAMLKATRGINTHKGIIFSLGIICSALGFLYGRQIPYSEEAIHNVCKEMTAGLKEDFVHITRENAVTNGERIYAKYGIMGARGEAISGFQNVFSLALPVLKEYLHKGYSQSDAGILALLHIIAYSNDTNIIARSNYQTMQSIQVHIRNYLKNENNKDYLQFIKQLDDEFIAKNISPGGSADLLALTYFIYFYEIEMERDYGF